jgi:hypothetical protein
MSHNFINAGGKPLAVYAVSNIDGTVLNGTTKIFTTDASSGRFYPTSIVCECVSTSGFVVVPSVSIGTNSASYNNVLAITVLTGSGAANLYVGSTPTGIIAGGGSIPAGTDVVLKVTTAATATTFVIKAIIMGFYA